MPRDGAGPRSARGPALLHLREGNTVLTNTYPPHESPFPTIPAGQLRTGDLIHRPGNHATYILLARAVQLDGVVQLMVYDSDHPDGTPVRNRVGDRVLLACRDLIEPDDGLRAWTDASWRVVGPDPGPKTRSAPDHRCRRGDRPR